MNGAARKRLGPYELNSPLGAGGMGEVFRARDTRLNRDVALKVLPAEFAGDADRLRRFEQEARTLATLNHPNIMTVFDVGQQEGQPYLVSELLEGRTLREELGAGALPTRKATDYALQIAQGLAAAHGKGVIHRDLKPENIFVTRDGRVKVLDFGLAKLKDRSPDLRPPSPHPMGRGQGEGHSVDPNAATLMQPPIESTEPGRVMGTPGYMAPEQVRGEPADHRSDIFAFGCVLYEILGGQRPFKRDTAIATMAAIMNDEPPELTTTKPDLSPALDRIVRRCLEKQPDHRFQSAKDLAFALEVLANGSQRKEQPGLASGTTGSATVKRLLTGASLVLVGIFGGMIASKLRPPSNTATATSLRYLTYSGRDFSPSGSADGKRVCFSSDRDGTRRILVKDLASGWETPLTTGPDDFPRFSPDGSSILFVRAMGIKRSLFRIPAIGGEPSRIVDDVLSGDWSPDGRQVTFVRWHDTDGSSSIYTAGIDGSAELLLARFANERCSHPRWSPDHKAIAVSVNETGSPQSIAMINVATRQVQLFAAPHPYYALSSVAWDRLGKNLFYLQAESASANSGGSPAALFRQNLASGKLEKLLWTPTHAKILDLLPSGNVLMDARSSRENLKELPIGPLGANARFLTLGNSTDRQPVYSPDGNEIAFSSNRSGNLELWSISRKTGIVRRLTDHVADDWDPAYSPDGKRLIWSANRTGNFEIWTANADGTAPVQVTHDGFSAENPSMTRDGRWVVYASAAHGKAGIWRIRPDGTDPTQLVPVTGGIPEVSPDGRYAAYYEDGGPSLRLIKVREIASGTPVPFEIRVEAVKETAAILGRLRWMPDGKAIAFLGQDERGVNGIWVQDFVPGTDSSRTRRALGGFDPDNSAESFGISPDGRFLTIATWEQFFSVMRTEDFPSR